MPTMKTTNLLAALIGAQCVPLLAQAQATQPLTEAAAPTAVVVTGSRIARTSLEGPSAVTVLTGEDITRQGYKNVFDALNNQVQNSGFVQGADYGNTFTPSANTIIRRGLGPNHTLILLNGRRLADFPIAYAGTVNFTNLANIPSNIVERIEILSGGASAIYGSDAIAGVINIILKNKAEGFDVNVKAGTTSRGGGGDRRVQFTGGQAFGKLNTVFSLELSERDPLSSLQRDFMSARSGTPTNILSRKNLDTGKFIDPGQACSDLADFYGGSTIRYTAKAGS